MTVEILRLSGLEASEAEQAASTLLDLRTGPRDLRNLLVLDDTALVVEHSSAYVRLDTAARVQDILCVAVGPRAGDGRMLRLPGNLGGTQGSPVLWVSDPSGIDWRVATAAIALGHPPGRASGLDLLVELLSVDDMFKRVHMTIVEKVPGRVANPGLHLAGADDEAATFAAALAMAIRRLCDPGQGADGPFPALLPAQVGGASLAEGGPLDRYRNEVVESVAAASDVLRKLTGPGGRFRHGGSAHTHLVEAGAALADLRDLVTELLQKANTVGELTVEQRQLVSKAGLRLAPGSPPASSAETAGSAAEQSLVFRTIADAIGSGDTLTVVTRRLTLTERELKRLGSASYLHQVEERCPTPLLSRLADPPQRLPRRAASQIREELGLDAAEHAANALGELVVAVANREWSPAAAALAGEVARLRVALDAVGKALTGHAAGSGSAGGTARGARLARLGDSLTPVLRDLVLRVLAAEVAQPSTGGQEAFGTAQQRAARLVSDWGLHVRDHGVLSRPAFATSAVPDAVPYAYEDDVPEVRAALLYPPREEMWQLCSPADLSVLNAAAVPEVVRFASRLSKDALAGTVPGDQPVWTSFRKVRRVAPPRLAATRLRVLELGRDVARGGLIARGRPLVMTGKLQFRLCNGEQIEAEADVDDAEFPAGEFLLARKVRLEDGTELRQHRPTRGSERRDGYERLDNEILAGRRLCQVDEWGSYPRELARLYGDEATSADPYTLFEPYRGQPVREVGTYLLDDEFDAFLLSLLTGLCWLAAASIAHRAINLDTVRWDGRERRVQITDFSRSTIFGVPRTPIMASQDWIPKEQRPRTCFGTIGPRDDIWAAGRLIFFVRNQGEALVDRAQIASSGLDALFNGMFDRVLGPPEGRPTARDLLEEGLRGRIPVPRPADGSALIAGRERFLEVRQRRHPSAPVPRGFNADIDWMGDPGGTG